MVPLRYFDIKKYKANIHLRKYNFIIHYYPIG